MKNLETERNSNTDNHLQCMEFSDPFTGAPITAIVLNDQLIFDDPYHKDESIVCHVIDEDYVTIPLKLFQRKELIESKDACMELVVSRQRISQLVEAEILTPIYLGNSQYFLLEDVLDYKKTRKPGRPRKEREC